MNDSANDSEHQEFQRKHLDIAVHEEALSDFQGLLKSSLHSQDLETWVKDSVIRQDLFADLALGQIKWPKSVGRPETPQLSDGFIFDTQFWIDIWHIGIDGSIVTDKNGWTPGGAPILWDGPGDSDHYVVKYMFYAANQNDNLIEVKFSNVHWQHAGHSAQRYFRRYLSAPGWQFYSAGKFTALPDITIGTQPFFHP